MMIRKTYSFLNKKIYLEDSVSPTYRAGRLGHLSFTVFRGFPFGTRVGVVLSPGMSLFAHGEDVTDFYVGDFDMQFLGETRPLRCMVKNISIEGSLDSWVEFHIHSKEKGDLEQLHELFLQFRRDIG